MSLFLNDILVPLLIMLPGFISLYWVLLKIKKSPYGFCSKLLGIDEQALSELDYIIKIKMALDKIEDEAQLNLYKVLAQRKEVFADFTPIAQYVSYSMAIVGVANALFKTIYRNKMNHLFQNYSEYCWASGIMILGALMSLVAIIISEFRINKADAVVLKELIGIRFKEIHNSNNNPE